MFRNSSRQIRSYLGRHARSVVDRLLIPVVITVIVTFGFVWLLHSTGTWDRFVEGVGRMFGTEAAERAEELGDKAGEGPGGIIDDVLDGAGQNPGAGSDGQQEPRPSDDATTTYVPGTLPNTKPGDDTQIDWAKVQAQLDALETTDESAAQRIEPYDRDRHFGDWVDFNVDGCREDDEVRLRDASNVILEPGTTCVVQSGVLHDPYSGKDIPFNRAVKPLAVEVEHIVSLHDVYYSGGWRMSQEQRQKIANDLERELVLVSRDENQAKKHKTPADWMPSDPAAWCWYAASYIDVKATYGLTVDEENRGFLNDVLGACKG